MQTKNNEPDDENDTRRKTQQEEATQHEIYETMAKRQNNKQQLI